jgi:murein DD-endopeptidase MepM/ murein hydrolase activator NlpD
VENENSITESYEEASSSIGKTIEEVEQEEKVEKSVKKVEGEKKVSSETKTTEEKKENKKVEVVIPDPIFIKPVQGEISKEYSKEKLVYSETLKEWTTHTGVDIESDLTTVVKSAAEGTVKAIKNDPRYGLTVIIEHVNGFETRYSNLLTAEFVVGGEKVSQGQTIGTVGNTASFEVADKPHLHFEILKNSEYLEPTSYIK